MGLGGRVSASQPIKQGLFKTARVLERGKVKILTRETWEEKRIR